MVTKKKTPKSESSVKNEKDSTRVWGSTNHDRTLEKTPKSESVQHRCKGPKCIDAFKE